MPNISARKVFAALGIVCLVFPAAVSADDPFEKAANAILDKFEQTAKPIFDYNQQQELDRSKSTKQDPFFDKIRKEQRKFSRKEQERRKKFIEKVRAEEWPAEKLQEELAGFHKKQLARRQKFTDKQQKKIQKHLED